MHTGKYQMHLEIIVGVMENAGERREARMEKAFPELHIIYRQAADPEIMARTTEEEGRERPNLS